MAIWDKFVLVLFFVFFFPTFIRKHATPLPLPDVPKIIVVENQNLLFDGLVP